MISAILDNIAVEEGSRETPEQGLNMNSPAKVKKSHWGKIAPEEEEVIVRDNELLQGILDKSQIGDSEFGLLHSFYEVYGKKVS